MAPRIPKSTWKRHKPTIESLYRKHHLSDVRKIMKDRYGFHAVKRQYVYRLEVWGVKKYNTNKGSGEGSGETLPQQDKGSDADNAIEDACSRVIEEVDDLTSPTLQPNNQPSPHHDLQGHVHLEARGTQEMMEWICRQGEILDLISAVPNTAANTAAVANGCPAALTLWDNLPDNLKATPLGHRVLSTCVRLGIEHSITDAQQALCQPQPQTSTLAELLRRNLLLVHFKLPGAPSRTSLHRGIGRVLREPEPHLELRMLIIRLSPLPDTQQPEAIIRTSPRARSKIEVQDECIFRLSKNDMATSFLRSLIRWCQDTYIATHNFLPEVHSQPLTAYQARQAVITEFSCYLSRYLLCEPQGDLPTSDCELALGISRIICVATITRMASNMHDSKHPNSSFTPYDQLYSGAFELLRVDSRTLWTLFFQAFLEVDEIPAMAPTPHTFPRSPNDNYTFFTKLNSQVQKFVRVHLPPEAPEALCPELEGTTDASRQGSHSPMTPMMLPDQLNSQGLLYDMSSLNQFVPDVNLMGIDNQSYWMDVAVPVLDPDNTFFQPALYMDK